MNREDKDIRKLVRQKRDTERAVKKNLTEEEYKEQIKKWTTFFRRNLEIYCEDYLQIPLKSYQRIMIHLMGISNVFFAICARLSAKSFIVSLYALCICLLKPFSWIVITSSTLDQGRKMIDAKIKNEFIFKISPVLKYMYDEGMITIISSKDECIVKFFNNSYIKVLPPTESSRGERATVLIYEECRILKRKDVDSIFEPMLEKRIPVFLNKNEEYEQDPIYEEDGISIYITSAGYKTEWFWTRFKEVVNGCFTDKMVSYNMFAFDIYNILKARLRTIKEWMKIERTTDPLHLMIEYQNVMIGSADNCFYSLDLVKKCQKLRSAFYPPTEQEALVGGGKQFREKKDNEIRILAIDYAFANTTNSSQTNDNTVIECKAGFYDKGEIVRNLDYLETIEGGESELTQRRIRELYHDYKADYLIMD